MIIPSSLETERLVIRTHIWDDLEPLILFFNNDGATSLLDLAPEQKTAEGTKSLLDAIIKSYDTDEPIFALAVVEKMTGQCIGSCGMAPDVECSSDTQIYYAIFPEYQGKGYALEAISKIIEYAFSDLKLEKVVARMAVENHASIKVAEKAGMIPIRSMKNEKTRDSHKGCRYEMRNNKLSV